MTRKRKAAKAAALIVALILIALAVLLGDDCWPDPEPEPVPCKGDNCPVIVEPKGPAFQDAPSGPATTSAGDGGGATSGATTGPMGTTSGSPETGSAG